MKDLFKQKFFLQSLFDAIPVLTLVVDADLNVQAVNRTAKEFLNIKGKELTVKLRRCGEVIRCAHTTDHSMGCGYSRACNDCIIKKAAITAREGVVTQRAKGKMHLLPDKEYNVLVSASVFEHKGETYSVVMVEDVSLVTELRGLLPICASCKRIRDDQGYWNRVEKFIEEHSEIVFTHDICPECMARLYPGITFKDDSCSV